MNDKISIQLSDRSQILRSISQCEMPFASVKCLLAASFCVLIQYVSTIIYSEYYYCRTCNSGVSVNWNTLVKIVRVGRIANICQLRDTSSVQFSDFAASFVFRNTHFECIFLQIICLILLVLNLSVIFLTVCVLAFCTCLQLKSVHVNCQAELAVTRLLLPSGR